MKNFSIQRGSHINFSCFSCGSSIEDKLTLFKNVAFSGEGKTEVPGKKVPQGNANLQQTHSPDRGTPIVPAKVPQKLPLWPF